MVYFKSAKAAREYAKKHPGYETLWYDFEKKMYCLSCL